MKWTLLAVLSFATSMAIAQTELFIPWMTNNATFRGTIIVNNIGSTDAEVTLMATRSDGQTESTTVTIAGLGQLVSSSADLFPTLGDGAGYAVRIFTANGDIRGGFVISGTESPSGSSPSQANVSTFTAAGNILLFNYLSIGNGFSSPVLYNPNTTDANVTVHAYQGGAKVAETAVTVPGGRPVATLTSTLFPDLVGDLYVVTESDQALLGVAFIFNDTREPSMSDATAISAVPTPGGVGADPVSFSADVQAIFNNSCGSGICHLNGSSAGGLNLDAENSYANIVGVPPQISTFSNLSLIEPGDADNSYLFRKLLPDAEYFGSQMPRGAAPLSDSEINTIRNWISQGAQNN